MVDLGEVAPGIDSPDKEKIQEQQRQFLEEFTRTHSRLKGMRRAGVASLSTIEGWVRDDPDFRYAYSEAQALLADQMESAAFERAVVGVDRPVFQGGELVGHVREYSDTLLHTLLKAKMPEQYGSVSRGLDPGVMGGDHGPLPAAMTIEVVHEIGREFGQLLARRMGGVPEPREPAKLGRGSNGGSKE